MFFLTDFHKEKGGPQFYLYVYFCTNFQEDDIINIICNDEPFFYHKHLTGLKNIGKYCFPFIQCYYF